MKKVIYILLIPIIVLVVLLVQYYTDIIIGITNEDIAKFIKQHNIQDAYVKEADANKYFIFSKKRVFVYEGDKYSETKDIVKNDITFGGLQKGNVGLMIENEDVLQDANMYTITIDQEPQYYEYSGEKYVIVQDERIWNPTPELTLRFTDRLGNILYEETL
ncbi:hypothetical protein [Paenibacillus lemnae]|uniref:Uncharacterized protein n=1 Tax=Paenibacillus lemnae TaxID=1330551 RepID=A0A848M6C3_PAELE|nr:hypothetical protein [Paenibacillus lemnae]NMO96708.1 hypothetical protein [Paenibacillus lemnae]